MIFADTSYLSLLSNPIIVEVEVASEINGVDRGSGHCEILEIISVVTFSLHRNLLRNFFVRLEHSLTFCHMPFTEVDTHVREADFEIRIDELSSFFINNIDRAHKPGSVWQTLHFSFLLINFNKVVYCGSPNIALSCLQETFYINIKRIYNLLFLRITSFSDVRYKAVRLCYLLTKNRLKMNPEDICTRLSIFLVLISTKMKGSKSLLQQAI